MSNKIRPVKITTGQIFATPQAFDDANTAALRISQTATAAKPSIRACVRECMRACVRACVRVCVRACVRVRALRTARRPDEPRPRLGAIARRAGLHDASVLVKRPFFFGLLGNYRGSRFFADWGEWRESRRGRQHRAAGVLFERSFVWRIIRLL